MACLEGNVDRRPKIQRMAWHATRGSEGVVVECRIARDRTCVWESGNRAFGITSQYCEQAKGTVAQHCGAWVCCSQGSRGFREPEGGHGAKNTVQRSNQRQVLARSNVVPEVPLIVSLRLWAHVRGGLLAERGREGVTDCEKEGGTPSGPARASDAAACSLLDTTAPLLGFDEGTLGQILPRFHHHHCTKCQLPSRGTYPTEDCQRFPLSCQMHFPCSLDTATDTRSSLSAPPVQASKETGKIPPMSRADAAFPTEASHPVISYLQLLVVGTVDKGSPPPLS